ncbi:MAG: hypothetical protein ACI9R3_004450 [Verrucomicrobiales bacterium]|jgi:hypothetical protein
MPTTERSPGQSPDELVHVGKRRVEEVQLEWVSYDVAKCSCRALADVAEALECLQEPVPVGGTRWLRVTGLHDVEVNWGR